MNTDELRAGKLLKFLEAIINGKQPLTSRSNARFFEAICAQPNAATCISMLISSTQGIECVQTAMRFDLTPTFFNGSATDFLKYVSSPNLTNIGGGAFLTKIIVAIVEPPIFWSPFTKAFQTGQLHEDGQFAFAWLLRQLIALPGESAVPHRELANNPAISAALLSSPRDDVRDLASQIKSYLDTLRLGVSGASAGVDPSQGPGGRHDNDFADFREIAILPTADELASARGAFLRPSAVLEDPDTAETRVATHLDNQFRLLREDMLYEMREELDIALGKKKGKFRGLIIDGLTLTGVHYQMSVDEKACKWGITLESHTDLHWFKDVKPKDRLAHIRDNKKIFRHQSMTCLIVDEEIVAFPTVNREEELLAKNPPVIVVQLEGATSTTKALLKLKTSKHIKLLHIDTAVFAYEPVLTALKEKQGLPFAPELLFWKDGSELWSSSDMPERFVDALRKDPSLNIQGYLETTNRIVLDEAQSASLLSGLTQRVSLIQGPPGTGKSFIGALLAKAIHNFTEGIILVVCYTNHALDQFLEDLLNIGIPEASIVRLGGKSTPKTASLAMRMQAKVHNMSKGDWSAIENLRLESAQLRTRLENNFNAYKAFNPNAAAILDHLELEFEENAFFEAFCVPLSNDGMQKVGRRGKAAGPDYLLDRWSKGQDAGMYGRTSNVLDAAAIWNMTVPDRQAKLAQWKQDMLRDRVDVLSTVGWQYNQCLAMLEAKFGERDAALLRSKRIIGCTTTAAAKYRDQINAARPSVLLVEEAGEILESHILTALSTETKQLILIGDHKQLRPKVNNYSLTVEKGDGLDLNRSLFERLVLKGYPHETLRKQHRMRPEISDLVRQITYPDLLDADGTKNRPNLRGVQDCVVFINHDKPEAELAQLQGQDDMTAKASKQNSFEVELVLKIVRYLGQQGYGTDKLVILTPYLGQLRALQEALKKDNDPVLNDLDSFDLVRAGMLSPSAAKLNKKPIRLATIDNYQGEESDIVIISLTRSNSNNDIGFMSSPERLTVLLSRARDAMIMIGNAGTFMKARKGNESWNILFKSLKSKGHIYGGFPVKCEKHPDRTALLKTADDFDKDCPDGGCREPCGLKPACGIHDCPLKCHPHSDHSGMPCEAIMDALCPKNHRQSYKCHRGPPASCTTCDHEKKLEEKKLRKQFERQEQEAAKQRAHAKQLAELDEQIAQQRNALRDAQLDEERSNAIAQKIQDLQDAADFAARAVASRSATIPTANLSPPAGSTTPSTSPDIIGSKPPTNLPPKSAKPSSSKQTGIDDTSKSKRSTQRPKTPPPPQKSAAREQWERQKSTEGASNPSIDAIMAMTGLEEVKVQVLTIKDKIDTAVRQNISINERFNVTMLGNPGTGKTTVARHYGKFLASIQVIPGNMFVETTGSRLAHDSIDGAKKHIADVLAAGGGTIFVDEAYQLTGSGAHNGGQVLDFLLAEIENLVGKVIFIFAGYDKEMEKFYEHNPGLPSRIPYTFRFKDYNDVELLDMLEGMIHKAYGGRMKVEDGNGIRGLYGRIAVRRLGRGRGTPGFGNARALENMFAQIRSRQAERLAKQRSEGLRPDDFLFFKKDLIGPDPSKVMGESAAWKQLRSMIGLGAVKKSVTEMFSMLATNYQRELLEKAPHQISLNRVFLGSPGTGKTTVAQRYGQILADLGMISNGEVVMKNPSDFIGSHIGQSEAQTKAILASTIGKVLVIDEAYMLYGGAAGQGADTFKTAVIDTIVAEVQSKPGDDRCVLLLGYKHQMEEMFQNVNPGLSRRFAMENAFRFDDFSDDELIEALEWKLDDQDLTATDAAKNVAKDVLNRLRNRPNFGNVGEVENLLGQAKLRYQERQGTLPVEQRSPDAPFEPEDFDPDYNRDEHAATNLVKLFEDIVGCDNVIKKMEGYQRTAMNMKAMAMDFRGQIPTNFIFKGPPGTGKTTVARKVGQIYYDMGFLSSTEVVECSASDLVGQYVGQTGPKTRKLFEKALGRVLFIDEAYRLSEGHFAQEAMDEMVSLLTQETFRAKLVVILAGYDKDMNALMQVNSGLSSRFPDEITFHNISSTQALEILKRKLKKQSIRLDALDDQTSMVYIQMVALIEELSSLPSWGNARDIETLSKQMASRVFTSLPPPVGPHLKDSDNLLALVGQDAIACIENMLSKRRERIANVPKHTYRGRERMPEPPAQISAPPSATSASAQASTKQPPPPKPKKDDEPVPPTHDGRDDGVTDAVWDQLQIDKARVEEEVRRAQEAIRVLEQQKVDMARKQAEEQALKKKLEAELAKKRRRAEAERQELQRKLNEVRIREQRMRAEAAKKAAELEAKRREEERKRREEAQVQTKIREMGLCVAGFHWTKQATGYRCAGGSHFINNAALGI